MPSYYGNLKSINTLAHLRSLMEEKFAHQQSPKPRPLVALSRDKGAGGEEVARLMAEKLGVNVYDRELLDAVAQSAGTDPYLMAELDEKVAHMRNAWVISLLTNQIVLNEDYHNHLVDVVLGLAPGGGVMVGRGTHLILAGQPVLRLRIVGSPEICTRRLMEREKISSEEAKKRVETANHERGSFIWEHFRSRLNDPVHFDLTINTDHIPPALAADLALAAMKTRGLT